MAIFRKRKLSHATAILAVIIASLTFAHAALADDLNSVDTSQEMRLAWDKWHKQVAEEIYSRFNEKAQERFKRSSPTSARIGYMVARDGRIGNVRIIDKSNNPAYDALLVEVIKSMAHDPILKYPDGSKRQFVEKSGTFTWNYSSGGSFPAAPLPHIGPPQLAK